MYTRPLGRPDERLFGRDHYSIPLTMNYDARSNNSDENIWKNTIFMEIEASIKTLSTTKWFRKTLTWFQDEARYHDSLQPNGPERILFLEIPSAY